MADRPITIATFDEPLKANMAKIKLESEGIGCFLAGENFVATYWLLANAEHGIKLQVKKSEAERALEILGTDEKVDTEQIEKNLTPEPINPQCPKCHCNDVEYEKFSKKLFYLSILFLRFPIPLSKKIYKCKNCGHTWKGR